VGLPGASIGRDDSGPMVDSRRDPILIVERRHTRSSTTHGSSLIPL
jgi:hypothetical protein